jgi:hypothetical protein
MHNGNNACTTYGSLYVTCIVLVTSDQEPDHTLTAGTSFGDESIIDKSVRTMTCSALTPAELLVISKSVSGSLEWRKVFSTQCPWHTVLLQDFLDLSLRQSRISYQKTKHLAFCKSAT